MMIPTAPNTNGAEEAFSATLRKHPYVFVMILLLVTSASDVAAAVYLSNLGNRWVDPGNPGVNDIGDIHNLFPGQYTFTASFTTGASSIMLDSITLEFLIDSGLFAPQPWTKIDVRLYKMVGNQSVLLGALGQPTINPKPTQWPQGSTGISDYTTYIDLHPMWRASLQPFSQYQISATDPISSSSAAGLLFSILSSYTAQDNWQMGPTTGNAWGAGEFLKLAVGGITPEAQFTYTTNNGAITITGYPGSAGYISIPSTLYGLPVTGIGQGALSNYYNLASVTIANTVTNIGIQAFASCPILASVYFEGNAPNNLSSNVFAGDTNATLYYLPGTTGWGATFGGLPTKLWNPQVQSGDASFGVRSNQFGFNISGTADIPVVVEAATSLAEPVWSPLLTMTLTNGLVYFSDPQWTNYPGRFYRLRSQ
jgi:hypothetical protein